MDLLNYREGAVVFYQDILLSPLQSTVTELWKYVRVCMSLKKQKSHRTAVLVTVNSKEKNSEIFCLDFVQEFDLSKSVLFFNDSVFIHTVKNNSTITHVL